MIQVLSPIKELATKSRRWEIWSLLFLCCFGLTDTAIAADGVTPPGNRTPVVQNAAGDYLFSETRAPAQASTARRPVGQLVRSRTVSLRGDRLRGPSGTGLSERLVLNLFDDTVLIAIRDRIERNASGSLTWIGHLEGIEHSSVLLVVRDRLLAAKVAFPGAVYEVRWISDQVLVVEQIDQSQFIDHETEVPEVYGEPDAGGPGEVSEDIAADDGSIIDVLVVYSPQARSAAGSVSAIEATIELAVAETNMAYESSGVNQRLVLSHMYESPEAQLSGFSANLDGLQNPGDSYLDGVHALRNQYHADFVQLIIEDSGSCGLAYLQATPMDAGFEDAAFGVTARTCATGNYSFGHELGHNMGLRHDWYVDHGTTPHTWAHGFTNPPDNWRTIMAYNAHCDALGGFCTRIQYFSEPDNSRGGDPMGVAGGTASDCLEGQMAPNPNSCDADSEAVLDSNAATNSQFRSSEILWLGHSTDWNNAANWTMNEGPAGSTMAVSRTPRTIDDVRIPSAPAGGNFPNIGTGTYNIRQLVIQTGASLSMSGGTLNVYGSWEEQGTGSFTGSGGTVVFRGGLDQSIQASAGSTFNHIDIGDGLSSQSVSLLSDLDVNGNFTIRTGASFSGGANTLEVAGNWGDQAEAGRFSPGTATLIFDGATQTIDKLTTRILLDEPFDEADGDSCCSSTHLPSGWVREQSSGSGFLGGDISGWGGNGGAAVRWDNSADAWLHTHGIPLRADASYEIEYKYRSLSNGPTHDFSVSYGPAQSSAGMTQVSSVTNAGNTSYVTRQDTFTVPADGTYYLGLRSQQNTGTGDGVFDEVVLREVSGLAFHNLEIRSSVSAAPNKDLAVNNNLTVSSGGTLALGTRGLTVEGMLLNNGTLRQTRDAPNAATTELLRIKNAAGTADRYLGVTITPSTGSMGATTLAVSGNQGCPGWSDTVRRCFEITPTNTQTALTRFYYRDLEQNGQTSPKVYHWNGTTWDDLGATGSGGSGEGMYVEASTTAYSPFVLGDNSPTLATIGDISLYYHSVDELLQELAANGNGRELLLALLADWNPALAAALAESAIATLIEALRQELDQDGDGLVAMLQWETLSQRGTVGFYAERQAEDARWLRINGDLLPAIIDAPLGAEYLLFDRDVEGTLEYRYRLLELEAWGTILEHGPWLLKPVR